LSRIRGRPEPARHQHRPRSGFVPLSVEAVRWSAAPGPTCRDRDRRASLVIGGLCRSSPAPGHSSMPQSLARRHPRPGASTSRNARTQPPRSYRLERSRRGREGNRRRGHRPVATRPPWPGGHLSRAVHPAPRSVASSRFPPERQAAGLPLRRSLRARRVPRQHRARRRRWQTRSESQTRS
jgi:hypothetical protein